MLDEINLENCKDEWMSEQMPSISVKDASRKNRVCWWKLLARILIIIAGIIAIFYLYRRWKRCKEALVDGDDFVQGFY